MDHGFIEIQRDREARHLQHEADHQEAGNHRGPGQQELAELAEQVGQLVELIQIRELKHVEGENHGQDAEIGLDHGLPRIETGDPGGQRRQQNHRRVGKAQQADHGRRREPVAPARGAARGCATPADPRRRALATPWRSGGGGPLTTGQLPGSRDRRRRVEAETAKICLDLLERAGLDLPLILQRGDEPGGKRLTHSHGSMPFR